MQSSESLLSIRRLFLDTAPVIYYAERKPAYVRLVDPFFQRLDEGSLTVVTSPVTLAECLVAPLRKNQADYQQVFVDLVANGPNCILVSIDRETAILAARLRARYNLTLTDAFQVAAA